MARGYLRWLDDHGAELEEAGAAADASLSDLAWTAGTGRSHFAWRAGVVFRDAHGSNEIGLFRRSGAALADVLRGQADPLTLLFSSGEPSATDLYRTAPVARAANRMLGDAIRALLSGLPAERRLRVIEVGAGTGSATAAVLPELPDGRYDYTYTDISAGFFAEAEGRFGGSEAGIEYRVLDIENEPVAQGFDAHGYDLVIASNVLHATRYLQETLAHCRTLLVPSGLLVALENLRGQGWLDLTFGQLDGWWRFADHYRPHHALASPAVWRQALGDAGYGDVAVLGVPRSDAGEMPDRGVILAQGPAQVAEQPGAWVLAGDRGRVAAQLAGELAARNQTVVLATDAASGDSPTAGEGWSPPPWRWSAATRGRRCSKGCRRTCRWPASSTSRLWTATGRRPPRRRWQKTPVARRRAPWRWYRARSTPTRLPPRVSGSSPAARRCWRMSARESWPAPPSGAWAR